MKRYKIYTIGAMSGLSLACQMGWRNELEESFRWEQKYDKLMFVHPPLYYNYDKEHLEINKFSEREVEEWEMEQILSSDIAVVNLDRINDSVGSHFELGAVFAHNASTSHHIFTIGIGDPESVHPWIKNGLFRCEDNLIDAVNYMKTYLLLS